MMPNNTLAPASDIQNSVPGAKENGPAYQHQDSSQQAGAMGSETHRQEAYYLFFMGAVGITLNILVIVAILVRRTLRKMTSAFLIHACFLNLLKSAYLIPFGVNLLASKLPSDCGFEGSSYVVIITTSAFNMVAMICAEAYTFGENNVGGKSRGSFCCVAFGVLMVYIGSLILHLGPTLIGGYFEYNPEIGNCSFKMGEVTGYIANVMWISIVTISLVAVGHFLCKMYKEIQQNQPNRVSMLVRSSITIMDDAEAKRNNCNIRVMVKEASHRAKIFVITVMAYVISWYPLFLLILIDVKFKVSPKVYQAFSFIAWTQGTVEPIIYICFDRQLNLLSRWVYCDRYKRYDRSTLAYLMARNRGPVAREESLPNAVGDGPSSVAHAANPVTGTAASTTVTTATTHNSVVAVRDGKGGEDGSSGAVVLYQDEDMDCEESVLVGSHQGNRHHHRHATDRRMVADFAETGVGGGGGGGVEEPTYSNNSPPSPAYSDESPPSPTYRNPPPTYRNPPPTLPSALVSGKVVGSHQREVSAKLEMVASGEEEC